MLRRTIPALLLAAACGSDPVTSDSDTGTGAGSTTTDLSESSGTTDPTDAAPTTTDAPEPTTTSAATTDPTTGDGTTGDAPLLPLDAPCSVDVADPTRLAVLTNDLMAPASVHVVELASAKVTADIAPAPSDPALAWGDGKLVVIGRFGINTLDVLDGQTWDPLASIAVAIDGVADPNPQALAFDADGRAILTAFASARLPVYDLDLPPAEAEVASLDLSGFADRDGSPEPGVAFTCGGVLFVGIQRLVNFAPVDLSYLAAIDLATGAAIDLDPEAAGDQGIALLGPWPKQVRLDPADPTGHTVLVLTSGVERVDLSRGTSAWAVEPGVLAEVGVDGFDPQAFAVAADGASVYLLATDGDYPTAAVHHIGLDAGAAPEPVLTGIVTRDKAIERVGDHLWVGDGSVVQPMLHVLDLGQSPPVELAPIALSGAPYLLLALP